MVRFAYVEARERKLKTRKATTLSLLLLYATYRYASIAAGHLFNFLSFCVGAYSMRAIIKLQGVKYKNFGTHYQL